MTLQPFPRIAITCRHCGESASVPKGTRKQFCGKPDCQRAYDHLYHLKRKAKKG